MIIVENLDTLECIRLSDFLLEVAEYKMFLKAAISEEAIKQSKEYVQFKNITKGLNDELGGVEERKD